MSCVYTLDVALHGDSLFLAYPERSLKLVLHFALLGSVELPLHPYLNTDGGTAFRGRGQGGGTLDQHVWNLLGRN